MLLKLWHSLEVFGGLRPILSRVLLDLHVIIWFVFCALIRHDHDMWRPVLLSTTVVLLATAGLTSRWTLTLLTPMYLGIQCLRFYVPADAPQSFMLTMASLLVVSSMFVLCVAFPAAELPPVTGPYRVGVVNMFLKDIPVKIWYPIDASSSSDGYVPYLDPATAMQFCRESMQFGAPPILKRHGWILHNFQLIHLRATVGAKLAAKDSVRFPVVVYSHGLGGNATVYSYPTMSLAARGYVVVVPTHLDGSAIVARKKDGTVQTFDKTPMQLTADGKHKDYVELRRTGTDTRCREFLAVTEAFLQLDKEDSSDLKNVSFRNRLLTGEVFFAGHSFGGGTALAAGARRPELCRAIIAHDPAIDWLPNDVRSCLFPKDKLKGLLHGYDGGTGGFPTSNDDSKKKLALHDKHMLILCSNDWYTKKWAAIPTLLEMHSKGRLGSTNGPSRAFVIPESYHNEFSDTCMLTPVWLARAIDFTGPRNPIETAKEIRDETLAFLKTVRSRSE